MSVVQQFRFGGSARDGGKLARFVNHTPHANRDWARVGADNPALTDAHTIFPSRVFDAAMVPRILVSGHNSSKIGKVVTKGAWRGMPIYTLTLEERATCPTSCHLWAECYGSAMPLARRIAVGPEFIKRLDRELHFYAREHHHGFVVRLHVLGDFYSAAYAQSWLIWLEQIPQLHAFGYTANEPASDIGHWIARANQAHPSRWAIRFSVPPTVPIGLRQATTIWRQPEGVRVPEGQICPVSLGLAQTCGSCGLCWNPSFAEKRIVFIGHGKRPRGPAHKEISMPTGGTAPRVPTLAERMAARGEAPHAPQVKWSAERDALLDDAYSVQDKPVAAIADELNKLAGTEIAIPDVVDRVNALRLFRPGVRPSVSPPPPASVPATKELLRTAERDALVRTEWPKGTDVHTILARFNALPGRKIDKYRLSIVAAEIGVKRPPRVVGATLPPLPLVQPNSALAIEAAPQQPAASNGQKIVRGFAITSDIPPPSGPAWVKYPYEALEVNESFLVEDCDIKLIAGYSSGASRKLKRRFICRREPRGVRVWRIAE